MSKEVKYFVKVFLTTLGLFGVSVLLLFLFLIGQILPLKEIKKLQS